MMCSELVLWYACMHTHIKGETESKREMEEVMIAVGRSNLTYRFCMIYMIYMFLIVGQAAVGLHIKVY